MTTILGISGSLRQASFNTALLRAAVDLMPEGATLDPKGPVLRTLGMRPWFGGRLMVSRAGSLIDAERGLTDESTRERLSEFLRGFVAFAER